MNVTYQYQWPYKLDHFEISDQQDNEPQGMSDIPASESVAQDYPAQFVSRTVRG